MRESRKIIGSTINARNAPELQRVIETKIAKFLPKLLASPDKFRPDLRWYMHSCCHHRCDRTDEVFAQVGRKYCLADHTWS